MEAQLSLIVVPLKGKSMKMHTVLHAIALLNKHFTQVSNMRQWARATHCTQHLPTYQDAQRKRMEVLHRPPLTLKRRVGYGGTNSNKKSRLDSDAMEDVEK